MEGLVKQLLLVSKNGLEYFPSNALALGFSVAAHFGLIFLIYFSGIAGSKHSELSRGGFSVNLIAIDLSIKGLSVLEPISDPSSPTSVMKHSSHTAVLSSREMPKDDSLFPLISTVKPHYFSAKELTRKLLIARDIPSNTLLIVPGVPEQAATLRIQVNEYGDVDKVIVEASLLPEAAQKLVIEEFEKIKFHPGEINEVAVKSELKIEVMLEDSEVKE